MTELDGTDPLFLWRFAQADEKLHAEARAHSFSLVPVVALYGVDTAPIYRTHPSVPEDDPGDR